MSNRNRNYNNKQGCLTSLIELFLVSKIYNWSQEKFGSKRGGCCGCLVGVILFVIVVIVVLKIVFNTDFTSFF